MQSLSSLLTALAILVALTVPNLARAAGVGDPAPSFTLSSLDGAGISYRSGAAGRPVVLVFWATWCPNCLIGVPVLKKIHERLKDRVDLYAINIDINDSHAKAVAYQRKYDLPYTVLYDTGSKITRQYDVMGTPTVIIAGKTGIIRYRDAVAPGAEDIEVRLLGTEPPLRR